MKKTLLTVIALLVLAPVLSYADSTNVSFSISPPPIGHIDPYFENEGLTRSSKALDLGYMNISSDVFSLNNFTLNYTESLLKFGPGVWYANAGVILGLGNINMGNIGGDWSNTPLTSIGTLFGTNYVAKLFYGETFKLFLAPGLDGNVTGMFFTLKNFPTVDYSTWPPSLVYKDVQADSMVYSIIPKISLQANWDITPAIEAIPFVTFTYNYTMTDTFIYDTYDTSDYGYTSINFGLEVEFFRSFLLSSMVQLLNNGSNTKIININISIPLDILEDQTKAGAAGESRMEKEKK